MIIDKENNATENNGTEGAESATENDANTQDQEIVDVSADESNADANAENQDEGTEGDSAQGENGDGEQGNGDEVATDKISESDKLVERLEALAKEQEEIKSLLKEKESKPAEWTEEQWAAKEKEVGVNRNAIKYFTNQNVYLYQRIMDGVKEMFDSRFGNFDKSNQLKELSKDPKFADAPKFQKDIDEFLSQFDPKFHSDPRLLKSAVVYARGKNMTKTTAKVRNEGERNRIISGAGRPVGSNGISSKGKVVPLTSYQKKVADLMGGENEYRKFMKSPKSGPAVIER